MATIEQLSAALIKADAAGNAADAKAFADAIRQMRAAPAAAAPVAPPAAAPAQMTTGQKAYQAIRPYAAPLVEAAGAIGGGSGFVIDTQDRQTSCTSRQSMIKL